MNTLHLGAAAKPSSRLGLSLLLLLTAFQSAGSPQVPKRPIAKAGAATLESAIRRWPRSARLAAAMLIEKYGEPSHCTGSAMVWIKNAPWRETVVYNPRALGKMSAHFLEQTVAYRIPADKAGVLERFDRRLAVNEIQGRLSARSDSEAMNFMLINLADEIAAGKRSAASARAFLRRTERLSESGKSSPYMNRFLFPSRDGLAKRRE